MKKKKIIFEEASNVAKYLKQYPKPSTLFIPEWYKTQKLFSNNNNDLSKAIIENADTTYKLCVPLIDTMTSGYMVYLPADIFVKNIGNKENYIPEISWRVDWQILDTQNQTSLGNYPIPTGYSSVSFRWILDWKIITPSEYSLWITHPSHRHDLPFFTLNGFVDTDKQPNKLLFPFFIKDGFEGIIKQGTPLAQILPVKRDPWVSEIKQYEEDTDFMNKNIMKINFIRTYRNFFWSKKEYK